MSVGSKWREWKHEAQSSGCDSYTNDVERLANRPDTVEEDQWRALVHYWSSTDAKGFGDGDMSWLLDRFLSVDDEDLKEMNDLAEVYPELNVPGSALNDVYSQVMGLDTHGNVRTLGKRAAPRFFYGPLYKRSQNEQRGFDKRVEIEVQKVTSTLKIEMEEKLFEAKKEIEVMDKKLSKAEEDMEMMKKKLSESNMNMEEKIDDKVKAGILAYVDSLGITLGSNRKSFSNEQVSNKSIEDCQQ
uniref:Leucine-rich repeat resistance protein n=1 Tax=Solanum tuberosum TaxID=4113 RepID=M1CY10_SOLTU